MTAMYVGVAVFWSVFVAELIGDKTIYTVTSLALRFRAAMVLVIIVLVYSVKMGVAVLFGGVITRLQSPLVTLISACAFFASAILIALRRPEGVPQAEGARWRSGAVTCITSLLLTEWGDPGQIVVAASAARFHLPWVVWIAGTLAMTTKGMLALLVGSNLRGRVSQGTLRAVAAASLVVLGIVTLARVHNGG
jgi:putative Ca2+/H+ antiporter (TMEM165/GDT1 family)